MNFFSKNYCKAGKSVLYYCMVEYSNVREWVFANPLLIF